MHYAVLRCQPVHTLTIYEEMDAFKWWTPVIIRAVRLPRSRKTVLRHRAAIPGVLFAPVETLHRAIKSIPQVSAYNINRMTMNGDNMHCRLDELAAMQNHINAQFHESVRTMPSMAVRTIQRKVDSFAIGDQVSIVNGPFAGVKGEVMGVHDDVLNIISPDFPADLKVSPFLLQKEPLSCVEAVGANPVT